MFPFILRPSISSFLPSEPLKHTSTHRQLQLPLFPFNTSLNSSIQLVSKRRVLVFGRYNTYWFLVEFKGSTLIVLGLVWIPFTKQDDESPTNRPFPQSILWVTHPHPPTRTNHDLIQSFFPFLSLTVLHYYPALPLLLPVLFIQAKQFSNFKTTSFSIYNVYKLYVHNVYIKLVGISIRMRGLCW